MSLRTCRACGLEAYSNIDLDRFVKNKGLRYGRLNLCKECFNRKYRVGGMLHDGHVKNCRDYYRTLKGRQTQKRTRERNREAIKLRHKAEQKRYRERNPEKIRAQQVGKSIPLDSACGMCGYTENLERHHPDYLKPLEIMTLCESCHGEVHRHVF